MDEGTLEVLRSPPPGLWRLPLPGDVAGGRCRRDGSSLLPRAHARQSGRDPRRSQPAQARHPRGKTKLPLSPESLVRLKPPFEGGTEPSQPKKTTPPPTPP